MELTLREKRIMEAIKLIKNEGKTSCTRQDIINKLALKYNYSISGYANTFKELEQQKYLIRASRTLDDKGKIRYKLNDVIKVEEINLIDSNIGKSVKLQDILKITNIEQLYVYKFTCKIDKSNKTMLRSSTDTYLYLNLTGLEELLRYLQNDGNITKNQELLLIKIQEYMQTKYNSEKQDNTYEDLDDIFDSLLKTVDTISTRINTFKSVKEDKETQIKRLECDKNFYKNKCDEYRRNVIRLQEKIDALRWG